MRLEVEAVLGVVVPAVVAAILLLLSRLKRGGDLAAAAGGALAAAGGFLAGYAVFDWAPLTPADRWHWLPYLGAVAALAGFVAVGLRMPAAVLWSLALFLAALAAWVVVPTWPDLQPGRWWWLAVVGGSVFCLWVLLDPLARSGPAISFFLLLFVVVVAGSVVLFFASSAKFAHLAGALAAVLAVFALFCWRRPSVPAARAAVPVFAVLLPGLLFDGHLFTYSEVPRTSFILVAAAPLALWVGALRPVRDMGGVRRLAVQGLAILVPLGVAVGLALAAQPPDTF